MSLNEKEILKSLNGIVIDESQLKNINIDIDKLQMEKIKINIIEKASVKSRKKHKKHFIIADSLLLLLFCSGILLSDPALAMDIPIIKTIIGQFYKTNTNYEDYVQISGQQVYSNGITVILNEILVDDSKLIIGYTFDSYEPLENLRTEDHGPDSPFLAFPNIKIDGVQIPSGGSGDTKVLSDTTAITYRDYGIIDINIPDVFKLDVVFNSIGNVKGTWAFNVDVNRSQLKAVTVSQIDKTFIGPKGSTHIQRVSLSPVNTSILYTGPQAYSCHYIFTDKGEELAPLNGFGNTEYQQSNFTTAKELPNKITLIPWKANYEKPTYIVKDTRNLPISFEYEDLGKLTINKIEKFNDKILVHAYSDSFLPLTLGHQLRLIEKGAEEDKDKKMLYPNRADIQYGSSPKDIIIKYSEDEPIRKYTKNKDYLLMFMNKSSGPDMNKDTWIEIDLTKESK